MNTEPDYHGNLVACLPAVFIFTVFCCFMYDNGFWSIISFVNGVIYYRYSCQVLIGFLKICSP